MDIHKIRIENMNLLAAEAGGVKELAEIVGTSANYLSQLKSTTQSETRGMGNRTARKIEKATGKPYGWLDELQTGATIVTQPKKADAVSVGIVGLDVDALKKAIEDAEVVTQGIDITPASKAQIIANLYLSAISAKP